MTDCVFCDFGKIKERTIATIDGVNIVITLGQITNGGYILLVPIKHSPCLGALSLEEITSFENLLNHSTILLDEAYQRGVTIFEHGIVGQTIKHSHLHLLPNWFNLSTRISLDFPKTEFQTINNLVELHKLYQIRQEPYLLWSNKRSLFNVCWNPPAEPEYLRKISAETLRVPERASWRKMDPALDKKLADETMLALFPIFNT